MGAWVNNTGYPIVKVTSDDGKIKLEQERFVITPSEDDKQIWPIPVHYATERHVSGLMLDKKSMSADAGSFDWIKINAGQYGLYRVEYENEMLKALGEAIRNGKINGVDSWGIENDLFATIRSSREPVGEYLTFIRNYCMNPDSPLNSSISGNLGWIELMSRDEVWLGDVEKTSAEFHKNLLSQMGWERRDGEESSISTLRGSVISSLGEASDKEVAARALEMFKDIREGKGSQIDPNIKSSIYGIAAWHGDEKTYGQIVDMYMKAPNPQEKVELLSSLGNFQQRELILDALNFSISKDVRSQDTSLISGVTGFNSSGVELTWEWTKKNWQTLKERFSEGSMQLPDFVWGLAAIKDPAVKGDVNAFFEDDANMRGDIKRELRKSIEKIDANISFVSKNRVR